VEPSVLHSQVQDFDDGDAFLYFVLGLISLSHRFIEQLEAEAKTAQPAAPSVQSEEPVARILV
jgi:hypothetical protein